MSSGSSGLLRCICGRWDLLAHLGLLVFVLDNDDGRAVVEAEAETDVGAALDCTGGGLVEEAVARFAAAVGAEADREADKEEGC